VAVCVEDRDLLWPLDCLCWGVRLPYLVDKTSFAKENWHVLADAFVERR